MRIRREQFDQAALDEFVGRFRALLHAQFDDARDVPRDELDSAIRRQVGRAQRYGFVTEEDVAIYVLTAWLMGETFDEHEGAQAILMAGDPAAERAAALRQWSASVFETLEGA